MSDFDISKTPLPANPVNKPASGTYGEKAAVERLNAALPASPAVPAAPQGPTAPGMPSPGGGLPPAPTGAVPDVLLSPTGMPDTPMSTPLGGVAPPPLDSFTVKQRRLYALQALAANPEVSSETREWAKTVIKLAVQGSAR
jgi:hypothetical protein